MVQAVPSSGETTAGTVHLHPQAGDDWKTWPDAKAVRAQLGLNPPQLSMYLRRGYIVQYRCADQSLRFHPGEVEMLRLKIEQGTLAEVQDLRESNVELKDVFKLLCANLKQQQEHNEKLFALITAPVTAGTNFLTECNRTLSQRVTEMEKSFDQSISTRESLLSLQHERDLSALKVQNRQENIRHGIDRAAEALGPVVQQVLANLGIPLGKKHPGLELLETLDPALVQLLYATAPLTEFQKQKLRELYPDLQWPEAPPEAEATPAAAAATDPPPAPAPAPSAPPTPAPEKSAEPPPSSRPEPPSTRPSRPQPPPRRRRRKPTTQGD